MTFTNEERREVAENLRKQLMAMREDDRYKKDVDVVECGNTAYRNIAWSVELYGNLEKGNYINIVERLADLIDRPTCELDHIDTDPAQDGYPLRLHECSNCRRLCYEIYGEFEYCPHCGAEVVE